jgi:hypothetical protein
MKTNTSKTIEEIDDLIVTLMSKIKDLEHDLRFQPHARHMIEELKEEVRRLFKRHQSSFVKPFRKGWIY